MCCIFRYRTKMNTVCIFSHNCPKLSTAQRSLQSTDMTDDHKVVNRRRSVNNIHLLYSMYTTCIHVVQRSTILSGTNIHLIVKTQPVIVRMSNIYLLRTIDRCDNNQGLVSWKRIRILQSGVDASQRAYLSSQQTQHFETMFFNVGPTSATLAQH